MKEIINSNPDINVKEDEYIRLLGYPPNHKLEGRSKELADWARKWYLENGRPWVYAIPAKTLETSNGKLLINNIEFSSKNLLRKLKDSDSQSAMLVAVSAGVECENKTLELWEEGKPDGYFFLEVFGSAVVERLITQTGFTICEWGEKNGYAVLPHYSPGYPGWAIEDQHKLLDLIKQKNNFPGEISVLETGMLNPKKSLLAVFGITNHLDRVKNLRELIPCETCCLSSCQYRRIPFKRHRYQIEDINKLQPTKIKKPNNNSSLTKNAKYTIGIKIMQKWSDEKLQINICKDNSVEAKFRYEGSTCSNMGHELLYDYHIKLSSQENDYKINSLECVPADYGYKYMCEYIREPDEFMRILENEKPYLGKSFNEVINWQRQFSPEGCYCKSESRLHKWGLAFEVLHYALTHNENSKSNKNAEIIF